MSIDWESYPNFAEHEFACQCGCGAALMDPVFLGLLQTLRERYGEPMRITSGYRCPEHNARVSRTGRDGPHTTGKAADIAIDRGDAWELLHDAVPLMFSGIGLNQKGSGRFIHLDILTDSETSGPRPTIWTY